MGNSGNTLEQCCTTWPGKGKAEYWKAHATRPHAHADLNTAQV